MDRMRILVLGTGLQGKAALHDLAGSQLVSRIIAADANIGDLNAYVDGLNTDKIATVHLDARDQESVADLMRSVQAVIVLLPQAFRASIARLAVASGLHLVDASYTLPAYQALDHEAAAKGLAILPELGLDPGIDLVMTAQAIRELDEVHELHTYGAGVPEPEAANNPLQYKVSWTFAGVLRSYQRPARLLRQGQVVDLPPGSIFADENVHLVDLEELGTMEAYPNGDAVKYLDMLRIAGTVQNAGRYSMRWPGHCAFWRKLVALGFLEETPIRVGELSISPRRFVHDLLLPQLRYQEGERDVAVVRVDARGLKDGERTRVVYQVVDRRDLDTGLLAMQRTVGYSTSIGAQMILRGDIQKRGLLSPATDVPADVFFAELRQRDIVVQRRESVVQDL